MRLLKLYDVLGEGTRLSDVKVREGVQTAYRHISEDFKDSVATWLYNYNGNSNCDNAGPF